MQKEIRSVCHMNVKSARIAELPSSIIIEILNRLPIKPLVRCRSVCKTWYTMLSEIYFYKLYSARAPTCLMIQLKGNSVECLRDIHIIESTDDSVSCRKIHIQLNSAEDISDDNEAKDISDDDDDVPPIFGYQVGNSCNGLICLRELRSREPIAIWNPILGQYVTLPQPDTVSDDKVVAGFGFSPRTKVYKVLRIFHEKDTEADKSVAEIYDFGVSSMTWRRIGDAPRSIPSRLPGCFVNSALHWILDHAIDSQPNHLIYSFDFGDESFRYLSPPPIFSHDEKIYNWSNLGMLSGCLSICATDAKAFRPDVEVWVMDEYGVAESWVKKLSIRDPAVDWWDPFRWIQVTNFLKNGDIILLCSHRYVLAYDSRERKFVTKAEFDFPAISHVLSFVSLKNALREDDPSAVDVKYL